MSPAPTLHAVPPPGRCEHCGEVTRWQPIEDATGKDVATRLVRHWQHLTGQPTLQGVTP